MLDMKEISPVELTELYLRRIEEFNQYLNAYLTITGDRALAEAKEAEARREWAEEQTRREAERVALLEVRTTLGPCTRALQQADEREGC